MSKSPKFLIYDPSTIDHTKISNIGTNSHTQIDTDLLRLDDTSGTNTGDDSKNLTSEAFSFFMS